MSFISTKFYDTHASENLALHTKQLLLHYYHYIITPHRSFWPGRHIIGIAVSVIPLSGFLSGFLTVSGSLDLLVQLWRPGLIVGVLGLMRLHWLLSVALRNKKKKHGQESAWFGLTLELKQTELGLAWIEADRRVDGLTRVLFLLASVPRNPQHR